MKTKLLIVSLAALLIAPLAMGDNPFREGTENRKLTSDDRIDLLQYAESSKIRLSEARDQGKGKSFSVQNDIYYSAIRDVILDSNAMHPRTELLMRYSLNQGLELTLGIPTADGKRLEKQGVLRNMSYRDPLTIILQDSIALAIKYYQKDREAVQKGTLLNLPYGRFAFERLVYAKGWLAMVTETKLQYSLSRTVLEHWLYTVGQEDYDYQTAFAEEIIAAQKVLDDTSANSVTTNDVPLEQKVRVLRKGIFSLIEKLDAKRKELEKANESY